MTDKSRVQFDFTAEQLARLDKLKKKIGATSRAEVVRRALDLLGKAVEGRAWARDGDNVLRQLEII